MGDYNLDVNARIGIHRYALGGGSSPSYPTIF